MNSILFQTDYLQTGYNVWMVVRNIEKRYNGLVVGMAPYRMIQIWTVGDGRKDSGDLTLHIDNERKPIEVRLKADKVELDIPTNKMQVIDIKNDEFLWKSSNYEEKDMKNNV